MTGHFGVLRSSCAVGLLVIGFSGTAAWADLVISSKPSSNISCGGDFCEPTAANAVLNAKDLEKDLAKSGNFTVQTTGQNGVEANNIVVEKPFASAGGTFLNLFANNAIVINDHITIGSGGKLSGLELLSNATGLLGVISCGPKGRISFGSTSDQFNINGAVAVLVDSLSGLASAVSSNPEGFYVLSDNYDASKDKAYHSAPIGTVFTGYFEALGNAIQHLTIKDNNEGDYVGLFEGVDGSAGFGVVRNLKLQQISIKGGFIQEVGAVAGYFSNGAMLLQSSASGAVAGGDSTQIGGLVGSLGGTILSSSSAVRVTAGSQYSAIGGLAGDATGTIENSSATGAVKGAEADIIGGLAGESGATITSSFATGAVEAQDESYAGGLVGINYGSVTNSYATGNVGDTSGANGALGGLIGYATTGASDSYSTGAVKGQTTDLVGGLVGDDESGGGFSDAYWNSTTSGNSQGAGNIANDNGITGLTSKQLRSGLPGGFESSVWSEQSGINNGFPYLIANPPLK